jgi:hypothetical protein
MATPLKPVDDAQQNAAATLSYWRLLESMTREELHAEIADVFGDDPKKAMILAFLLDRIDQNPAT